MSDELPSVRLDVLFRTAKYIEGVAYAFEMIQRLGETSFYCFCLGRNFLYLNERESAHRWLQRAVESDRPFAWAHYEMARLHDELEATPKGAGEAVRFLRARAADPASLLLNRTHEKTLLDIAHGCFAQDRAAALPLYLEIYRTGFADYLTHLRVAEAELDAGRAASALAMFEQIEAGQQPLDAWGLFCLARAHRALGDLEPAAQTVLRAVEALPENLPARMTAAHRLLELGRLAEAGKLLDAAEKAAEAVSHAAELNALRFRLAVYGGKHADVPRHLSAAGGFRAMPNWLLVEAVFTLAKPGDQITAADLEVSTMIVRHLEQDWPFTLPTVLALFHFYNRRRQWDAALTLVERLRPEALFDHSEVVLRVFELYCIVGEMEKAAALYERKYAGQLLSQSETCVVLRFLSEIRDWDAAATLLLQFIDSQYAFPQGEYLLLQICRRRGLHNAALAHIDALGSLAPAALRSLRGVIADDLCLQSGAATLEGEARHDGLARQRVALSPANALLLKPASPPAPAAGTGAQIGFLCTDRNYFLSVLTFLASYAVHNPERQDDMDWAVFLDRSVPVSWGDLLIGFASKIGVKLQTIREDEFLVSDTIHMEGYGIFTGGSTLSRAAYLRIYAARHLLESGIFQRAFYVDSDIICLRSIEPFLRLDFDGAALMARPEETVPEVTDAALQHGIAPGCYFNSGVLAFNFAHRDIATRLEQAIDLAEHHQDRLIYHDQCALNIAFRGEVRFLEPLFNHFLRPHRPDNGDHSAAVFIHFLDKPKPWDVTFSREYRAEWLEFLRLTRLLLPADAFLDVVQAANGGDLRPASTPIPAAHDQGSQMVFAAA